MIGALKPPVRSFVVLTEPETLTALAALEATDPAAAGDPRILRNLGMDADGTVVMCLRHPLYREAVYHENPWHATPGGHLGMMFETRYHALPEGIAILRDPNGDHEEVLHREAVSVAQRTANTRAEQARREAEDKRARERQQAMRRREELGLKTWLELEAWQRLAFRLALIFRDTDPKVAARIRALASDTHYNDDSGPRGGSPKNGPGFPDEAF